MTNIDWMELFQFTAQICFFVTNFHDKMSNNLVSILLIFFWKVDQSLGANEEWSSRSEDSESDEGPKIEKNQVAEDEPVVADVCWCFWKKLFLFFRPTIRFWRRLLRNKIEMEWVLNILLVVVMVNLVSWSSWSWSSWWSMGSPVFIHIFKVKIPTLLHYFLFWMNNNAFLVLNSVLIFKNDSFYQSMWWLLIF